MSKDKKESVLEQAKENLRIISDRWSKTNEIGKMCLEMVAGDQWEPDEIKGREDTNRPYITINKLANNVNIVVNKMSQDMARIKVAPFEDADKDTAVVINGLLRHIQYSDKSDSLEAMSHGFFDLVSSGKGFWRVETQYDDDMSMDQEILISKIQDPNSVFIDPDGHFAFVVTFMSCESYEAKYGEEKESGNWDIPSIQATNKDDEIMVVEYWVVEDEPLEIYKVEVPEVISVMQGQVDLDGAIAATMQPQTTVQPPSVRVVTEDELKELPEGTVILEQRTSKKSKVTQYIFSGDEQIEKNDWAGKYLPIIGCYSREFTLKSGDKFYKPLVYDALDPQKMYNFDKSQQAEFMMMAPKAQWVGFEGQFEGHEDEYSNANTSHVPYLESKPVTHEGQLLPPPQRTNPPPFPAAFSQTMAQDSDEIKATLGIFDASLGNQGNESSGRAIIARRQQGDLSTYHFTMFFNQAMRRTGLVLVDLIPKIYDTVRTVRILGEDMTDKIVKINQQYVDEDGKPRLYDLKAGRYDVKIEIGPSAITRRQENLDSIIEMTKAVPGIAMTSPDLIVRNANFEYSDEIAARLQAGLPPGLKDKADQLMSGDKSGPKPEQIAMQQMGQQLQQMQGAVQKLAQENQQLKQRDQQAQVQIAQMKMQADMQREQLKATNNLQVADMNNKADIQQEIIRQQGQAQRNIPMRPAAVPVPMRNNNRQ